MDILSTAAIGTALAADAMAVSFSRGMQTERQRKKEAFLTALSFGIFQMMMPVLGWSIGKVGRGAVMGADHIIAFLILLFLGGKMLLDARRNKPVTVGGGGYKELLLLSVATSIDALASGMILPVSVGAGRPSELFLAVVLIGMITFVLSFAGFCSGGSVRRFQPRFAEAFGGIVLIVIAVKTLLTG